MTESSSANRFEIPVIVNNEGGWGPVGIPEKFADLPYQPFGKGDRLGKCSDWTFHSRNGPRSYNNHGDEEAFTVVEASQPKHKNRSSYLKKMQHSGFQNKNMQRRGQNQAPRKRQQMSKHKNRRFQSWKNRYYRSQYEKRILDPSIEVKPEWSELEQVDLNALTRLSYEPGAPEDLIEIGENLFYDSNYTNITTKSEARLSTEHETLDNYVDITTSDDPIMKELADSNEGDVFVTDTILALLMASPRSVYSWDVVIHKVNNKIFFDRRYNSVELEEVNETAVELPDPESKDIINRPSQLAQEATLVNKRFAQQVVKRDGQSLKFDRPTPSEFETPHINSFRYRRWNIGGRRIVVRCTIDAVRKHKTNLFMAVRALTEYFHIDKNPKDRGQVQLGRVDWRKKIDQQPGAVLATELKNNSFKLARWTCQALMSGVDQFMLGYVSRVNPRDNQNHVILKTQLYDPLEFAGQINVSESNVWGIVKALLDMFVRLDEGKYLLMKDPNKPIATIFSVPANAFEEMGGEDDDGAYDDMDDDVNLDDDAELDDE